MKLNIAGRDVDLGESLKQRIEDGVTDAVAKYFDRDGSGHVSVAKQGHLFEVDINIHLPSGINLQASGNADDAHDAFNKTLERIEKRIRRHHRRLKDHHKSTRSNASSQTATSVILAAFEEGDGPTISDEANPLTIAETDTVLQEISVSDAVFQLELMDTPAIMFINSLSCRINMVYKRPDGHIGWVDPKVE